VSSRACLILVLWFSWLQVGYAAIMRDPTQPPGYTAENSVTGQATSFKISAILVAKDRKMAIINGQMVNIGDDIAGAKVINIEPEKVQLEISSGMITIPMYQSIRESEAKN
jgi:hypothetical protein